jgi:uncharacterized protein
MNEKGMPVMKISIEQIKALLYKQKSFIHKTFNIKIVGVFGSYARNEQTIESDLDILVCYDKNTTLFNKIELQPYLEELFGVKVDLVAEEYIKPSHYESIMEGLVRVYQ